MKKIAFLFVAALAFAACGGGDDDDIDDGTGSGKGSGGTEVVGTDYSESEKFELVDMGTSVLWANMNLGSETAYDKGGFYQWSNLTGTIEMEGKTVAACRLPSKEEWDELCDICGKVRVQGIHPYVKYGVVKGQSGYLFRSGITGNIIFFPFAGWDAGGGDTYFVNKKGRYWASTFYGNNGYFDSAWCYTFANGGYVIESCAAIWGLSVRVVSTK